MRYGCEHFLVHLFLFILLPTVMYMNLFFISVVSPYLSKILYQKDLISREKTRHGGNTSEPGMVVHACNPSPWKAEAGGL